MLDALTDQPRLILKATLSPTVGSTFQPTGFPDLGAAEFDRPTGNGESERALIVESVQSLANHLERVGWDAPSEKPAATLAELPYIEVRNPEGDFLTSSRLEPHRLAGAYIRNAALDDEQVADWLTGKLGLKKGAPVDWQSLYRAVFELDPMCLLHGVFFSDPKWRDYGNPKIRRAVTAVMEAHGARPVVSGGVKRDDVNPTHGERNSAEGYGFVPFGRTEYTADAVELGVAVDLEQIRGYGLSEEETALLVALTLWEIRALLDHPLRLRTACDLVLDDDVGVVRPDGWVLPSTEELAAEIERASEKLGREVTTVVFE